jgi:hypothetical protein
MNKTRWLSALLIASWTLNVALIVAYVSKNAYPIGARVGDMPPAMRERDRFPDMPEHLRRSFFNETAPLHDEFQRLVLELSSELIADTLDSVRFSQLSDSLQTIRSELQSRLMHHLCQVHDVLPPEGRRRLAHRLKGMMEGHGPGMKHGRSRFNRDGGLFRTQFDSNLNSQNSIKSRKDRQ